MGIINVTPDSFYSASRVNDEAALVERVRQMVADGADVLDVGACSTRPDSQSVDAQGEMQRLQWALAVIRREAPDVVISVDTFRADVNDDTSVNVSDVTMLINIILGLVH